MTWRSASGPVGFSFFRARTSDLAERALKFLRPFVCLKFAGGIDEPLRLGGIIGLLGGFAWHDPNMGRAASLAKRKFKLRTVVAVTSRPSPTPLPPR